MILNLQPMQKVERAWLLERFFIDYFMLGGSKFGGSTSHTS